MNAQDTDQDVRLEREPRRVLGAWIKLTAQAMGLRQVELADRCDLDRMTVSRLYTGRVVHRRDYALVCEELGYTFDDAMNQAGRVLEHVLEPLTREPEQDSGENQPVETRMSMDATVITVCAQKGGAGKTTTTMALASMFWEMGYRVLVIDLDEQAASTLWAQKDVDPHDGEPLLRAIRTCKDMPVTQVEERFGVVASGSRMIEAEDALKSSSAGFKHIEKMLREHRADYDYVLIDTPGKLGAVTVAALRASTYALVPCMPSGLNLDGVERTAAFLRGIQEDINEGLEVLGAIVVGYDKRKNLNREIARGLEELEELELLTPYVPTSVRLEEASSVREFVHEYCPNEKAVRCYRKLAKTIDERRLERVEAVA